MFPLMKFTFWASHDLFCVKVKVEAADAPSSGDECMNESIPVDTMFLSHASLDQVNTQSRGYSYDIQIPGRGT